MHVADKMFLLNEYTEQYLFISPYVSPMWRSSLCGYVSILPSGGITSPIGNIWGGGGQHSHLIWRFSSKNTTSPTMLGILTMMLSASALMAGLALGKRKQEAHLVFDACTG